jgi:Asp-tRNA(Asn)/Glu-tRNA(Gln) amidotransferase B subunit
MREGDPDYLPHAFHAVTEEEMLAAIERALVSNPSASEREVVGAVMREFGGKCNPATVAKLLKARTRSA